MRENFSAPFKPEAKDSKVRFRTHQEAEEARKKESDFLDMLFYFVEVGELVYEQTTDEESGKKTGHCIKNPRTGKVLFYASLGLDDIITKYRNRFKEKEQ